MQGTRVWSLIGELRFCMLQSNQAHAPQLPSPSTREPVLHKRNLHITARESPQATVKTQCSQKRERELYNGKAWQKLLQLGDQGNTKYEVMLTVSPKWWNEHGTLPLWSSSPEIQICASALIATLKSWEKYQANSYWGNKKLNDI